MKTFIIILFINVFSIAQEDDPIEFFPHHEGDIFEYEDGSESGYFQNIITKDSLGEDGKYYIDTRYHGDYPISTYFGKMSIDTVNFEVRNNQWGGGEYTTLIFKLDADSGDTWMADTNSIGFVRAQVLNTFPAKILNEDVTIKYIEYTFYEYPDTNFGLYLRAFYLSSKFGIIAEFGDPPGQPNYYLKGAKINGTTYGIITSIIENSEMRIDNFTLLQNYPNPFNPITNIELELSNEAELSISIYNILGQQVAILYEGLTHAGNFKIQWNATGLASGIYFCMALANGNVKTIKMILVS